MRIALINVILSFVGVFLAHLPHSESCSPEKWKPSTVIENIMRHEMIIYATVRRQLDHKSDTYTAEVEVHCILRGPRTPTRLNITDAGFDGGWCEGIDLNPGERYIIGMSNDYRARAPEVGRENFLEAIKACGLNPPTFPFGVDKKTSTHVCPAGLPPGKCKEH